MILLGTRSALAALLALAALAASPSVASAEIERPAQAEATNGLFLSYAPRPDDEGAVCLVDSGIDENRDTDDGIIERTSVAGDGSSGEDGDTDERHGTFDGHGRGRPAQRLRDGGDVVAAQARGRPSVQPG